jgi:hypothetical protein
MKKDISNYFSVLGKKGGSVRSEKKKLAAKERIMCQLAKNRRAKVDDVKVILTKAWKELEA